MSSRILSSLLLASFLLGPLLFMGCSFEDTDPPTDPGSVITFDLEADLAPGEEAHFCRYVRMPTSSTASTPTPAAPYAPIFIRGGLHDLSQGTHHYLLYRTRLTDAEWKEEMANVVRCDEHADVMRTATRYVTGGQTPHEDADFPAAAALKFRPGEILLLQGHFVNARATPRKGRVDLELRTMAESAVEHEAGVLRYYNPFIVIPPRGKATAKMACTIKKDVTLLSAAAHMHARGVAYRAYIDEPITGDAASTPTTSPTAPTPTPTPAPTPTTATATTTRSSAPFYTTKDGLHPTFYTGFKELKAGTTIRFECDYESNSDDVIVQGISATSNEMCMFSGFYYPAMDPNDEICEDMSEQGTGSRTCTETLSCLERCPVSEAPNFEAGDPRVGTCWQQCITSSCPGATKSLFPELTCTKKNCAKECEQMGDTCRSCVTTRCTTELDACTKQSCDLN